MKRDVILNLKKIDLSAAVDKKTFKDEINALEKKLALLQRNITEKKIPVIIIFEGWGASGKGGRINDLILNFDPRCFKVCNTEHEEKTDDLYYMQPFWSNIPSNGRFTIFDRSWYYRVIYDRVDDKLSTDDKEQMFLLERTFQEILTFEQQLADDGTIIIKFFLHISKKTQKERFEKLKNNKSTA